MLEMMTGSLLKKISEPGLEIDPSVFQKLVASDGASGDQFGFSIDVSNDSSTIVIGALLDDNKGENSGSVYVFTKQVNGDYLQIQKLVGSDGADGDQFGYTVAISNDSSTIVVGARLDDDKGTDSGSAYVFIKQADGSYLETQKLVGSDGADGDQFGYTVAISNDSSTIIVGACYDDDKGSNSGSAYIFTKQANGGYQQIQKLTALDGTPDIQFGFSVASSGDGSTIVVSAIYGDNQGISSGSVYIFTRQANGSYLQSQRLVASDGAVTDNFGNSVAISADGSTVIVGACFDDDKGTNSGSVYIFTQQANGSYLQTQKLVALDGAATEFFGFSVAVSGNGSTVVVGAQRDNDKGIRSGSTYIFTKQDDGSYLQTHKLVASDGAANNWFGYSVALSQTSVVVSAFGNLGKGAVYVY